MSGALIVVPITIATGGALTSTNVGTTLDPAAYNAATTYAIDIQVVEGETIYQSAVAGNLNKLPSTNPTLWIKVGAINRLKMFDKRIGSQTLNADTIVTTITPLAIVAVLSLRNIEGISATATQTDPVDGLVLAQTIALDEPVSEWDDYWFSAIELQTDVVFAGLLPYTNAVITVTLDNTGGTAKCGALLLGPAMDPGGAEYGLSDGIDDFSIIAPDKFGVRDIVIRDYADNMELTVWVAKARTAAFKRLLTKNRAKAILVIAHSSRPDAQVYGLAETWKRVLSYPQSDVFSITMKGLT